MLVITVGDDELFNEDTQEFERTEGFKLRLEHSLISLSKWESKYQRPFLGDNDKSTDEVLDYIRFMILDEVDSSIVEILTKDNLNEIRNYIDSPQSATTFGSKQETKPYRPEVVTAELIYYWMVGFNIPFSCEEWHLNRLLALIRICNIKNGPQKKMSKSQIAQRNRELNEQRKKQLGTTG